MSGSSVGIDISKHMLSCEARYWLLEGLKMRNSGVPVYQIDAWWERREAAIERKRGKAALQELLDEMKRQQARMVR